MQPPQVGRDLDVHRDVLGKGAADEPAEFPDQAREIHRFAIIIQPAREGQHLADQVGAAPRARRHHVQQRAVFLRADPQLEQVDRHHDRGEHVVEVVGDAAGEHADAAEPLGMQELVLQALLLGDVAPGRQHGGRGEPRLLVGRHRPEGPLPPRAAAGRQGLVLAGLRFRRARGPMKRQPNRVAGPRRHQIEKGAAIQRVRRTPAVSGQGRVGVGDAAHRVQAADPVTHHIEDRSCHAARCSCAARRRGGPAPEMGQPAPRQAPRPRAQVGAGGPDVIDHTRDAIPLRQYR